MTTRSSPRPLEITRRLIPTEFWLWPNRLSLQAPLVAVLWQILLAHCLHVELDLFAPWALGMAVWLIYVADHLVDTARPRGISIEPPRKQFCRRHWTKFLVVAIVIACALAADVFWLLGTALVRLGWHVSVGVACYFALIHLAPPSWRKNWPREVVVAAIFTVGTFGAVWLANGRNTLELLPPATIFMLLCCANCSLIETWEWEETPNRTARWIASHLGGVGCVIALGAILLASASLLPAAFAFAAGFSGLALSGLAVYRHRLPIRFVSPLADLALCSPLLIFFLSI